MMLFMIHILGTGRLYNVESSISINFFVPPPLLLIS